MQNMYMNVHGSIIHNSKEVKQPKPPSSDEWTTKCGIYTQWNIIHPLLHEL